LKKVMFGFRVSRRIIALALVIAAQSVAQSVKALTDSSEFEFADSPALSPDGKTLAFAGARADYSCWIFVRALGGGPSTDLAGRGSKEGCPGNARWSPDGKRIVFSRDYCESCNDELFVAGYPSGGEQLLGEVCKYPASWTPDGRFLIGAEPIGVTEECAIALIPVDGSRRVRLIAKGDIAAVSPDGRRLAYSTRNQLKVADLTSSYRIAGAPVTLAREPHAISSINWVPGGRAVLYQVWADGNYYSRLVSAKGLLSPRIVNPGGDIEISQILADGSGLGTEHGGESALWRVDLSAATQEPERVRGVAWTDQFLCVSPDGELLAFAANRNGPTQIWISRLDGSDPRVLVPTIPPFGMYGDGTSISGISWSPDGRWIALLTEPGIGHGVDDARMLLVPAAGGPLRVLVELSQSSGAPPWSADSRFVFTTKEDENYKASYFQVEVLNGRQTAVPEGRLPPAPRGLTPLPSGAQQPHLAQDGRFLYFQERDPTKGRLVTISRLVSGAAGSR
jgi:Tol biopolymer transport system component